MQRERYVEHCFLVVGVTFVIGTWLFQVVASIPWLHELVAWIGWGIIGWGIWDVVHGRLPWLLRLLREEDEEA